MAFVKVLAVCFICVAYVLSAQAADLPPLPPRPPKPPHYPPPHQDPTPTPEYPSEPPDMPAPQEPQQPPQQGCYDNCHGNGQVVQRSVWLNCPVVNNYINLAQVLNLGPELEGYQITSVQVTVNGGIGGSQMSFLVNGQVHGSFFNPYGLMNFAPQYPVTLSCQSPNVFLAVQGSLSISLITVNLQAPGYGNGGYSPRNGY